MGIPKKEWDEFRKDFNEHKIAVAGYISGHNEHTKNQDKQIAKLEEKTSIKWAVAIPTTIGVFTSAYYGLTFWISHIAQRHIGEHETTFHFIKGIIKHGTGK